MIMPELVRSRTLRYEVKKWEREDGPLLGEVIVERGWIWHDNGSSLPARRLTFTKLNLRLRLIGVYAAEFWDELAAGRGQVNAYSQLREAIAVDHAGFHVLLNAALAAGFAARVPESALANARAAGRAQLLEELFEPARALPAAAVRSLPAPMTPLSPGAPQP